MKTKVFICSLVKFAVNSESMTLTIDYSIV